MSEADNVWRVHVDEVELDHGTISGRRVMTVDGAVVAEGQKFFDTGSTHTFDMPASRPYSRSGSPTPA